MRKERKGKRGRRAFFSTFLDPKRKKKEVSFPYRQSGQHALAY